MGSSTVRRESGLIVPTALATAPEQRDGKTRIPTACDPDGRRRIVWTADEIKRLDRVLRDLARGGQAMFVVCHDAVMRADGRRACGELMAPEGRHTDDPGYGCRCTRIHSGR